MVLRSLKVCDMYSFMSTYTGVYLQLIDLDTYNYFYKYTRDICIKIRVFIYTLITTKKFNYSYKCNNNLYLYNCNYTISNNIFYYIIELPSKLLEQIAFNTQPTIEEHF